MENQYITIAIQTRERAEKIVKKAKEKGIDCQLEIPELTGDSKEEKIKIRVKISDIEKALDITEEIDKVYGKEIIDVPREDIHINKILIPVVFKSYSEKGPFLALSLANKLKAEVHLFHTYFNPFTNPLSYTDDMKTSGYFDNNVSSIEDHSIEKMQQLINQLHKKCEKNNFKDVILDYTVTGGNLFNELERKSKIYEPDMLVLGTKGKNKKNNDLIGSFTSRVIKNLGIPVLAIPEDAQPITFDKFKILYVTDFDPSDYSAIHRLVSLTHPFNPTIHCVHVERKERDPRMAKKLDKMKEYFDNNFKSLNITCEILKRNDVLSSLQEFIEEKSIDLLSMNIHKSNMFSRLFVKKPERRILFHTNLPLLVYHF